MYFPVLPPGGRWFLYGHKVAGESCLGLNAKALDSPRSQSSAALKGSHVRELMYTYLLSEDLHICRVENSLPPPVLSMKHAHI